MRTGRVWALIPLCMLYLSSCDKSPGPGVATQPDGKAVASKSGSPEGLTEFERSLVGPILEELRKGVLPYAENSIGICKGAGKNCEAFLGTDVGELPEGKYMIGAEFLVPNVGPRGTWKVSFETQCDITTKQGESTNTATKNYTKTYDVMYVGSGRGYKLSPLRVIESPMKGASARCTYKLISLHPDGNKEYTGSWSVPEATQ